MVREKQGKFDEAATLYRKGVERENLYSHFYLAELLIDESVVGGEDVETLLRFAVNGELIEAYAALGERIENPQQAAELLRGGEPWRCMG